MHLYSFFFLFIKKYSIDLLYILSSKVFKINRAYLSKTFFSHYFKTSDLNKNGLKYNGKNVSNSVQGFYAYFEHLNRLQEI